MGSDMNWYDFVKDWQELLLLSEVIAHPQVLRREGAGVGDVPEGWTRQGHVYRGMTDTEYRATVGKRKPIKSTGAWSFAEEGTCFADAPEDAESYANSGRTDPRATGHPTYLVEVKRTPEMKRWPDGYIKTPLPVPFSEVSRIWKMYAVEGPTGRTTLDGWSGQVVAELIHQAGERK